MHKKLKSLSFYKEHATTILFFGGFSFDLFILPDIDDPISRALGAFYLGVIAVLIIFREWLVSRNTASKREQKLYAASTLGIAYFSGSALSFICVYAVRSAAFSVSWPFLLILLFCVAANEFISSHQYRFTLDVGVFFVSLLFFIVFNMPVIFNVQNDLIFLISIAVTGGISLLYSFLLTFSSESAQEEASRLYSLAIGVPMFFGMFYFLNVLPAVPLSLRESGVYHYVYKDESGNFFAKKEISRSFFSEGMSRVYHLAPSDNGIYFFSSVYAPAELKAPLSHVWERYDTKTNRWVEATTIPFTLSGGRGNGYRAYSHKESIDEGLWRVTVKADSKRIVGRVTFRVVMGKETKTEDVQL